MYITLAALLAAYLSNKPLKLKAFKLYFDVKKNTLAALPAGLSHYKTKQAP
jgi:hypothetical protein